MNGLNKFMDGIYKIIEPVVQVVFALFITIAGNMGIQSTKALKALSSIESILTDGKSGGGTGFITFFQILYWLVAIVFIGTKVLNALHVLTSNPQILNSMKATSAPANAYAQPQQFAQPGIPAQQNAAAPTPVPAPAANAGADRFCTQCGAKVPAGNTFCTGCGAKLD